MQFLEMRNTQDWSNAGEIIADDYAPLYSYPDIIRGRDAYKQRMASNPLSTMFESTRYDVVASAMSDDFIFFLADMHPTMHSGKELLVGFLATSKRKTAKWSP